MVMRRLVTARWSTALLVAVLVLVPATAKAETPSPAPSTSTDLSAPTATPSTTASPLPTPTPSAPQASPSATEAPSLTTSPTATPTLSRGNSQALPNEAVSLTLAITAGGTSQPGRFYEDIGHYAIRGTVSDRSPGTQVAVYWYSATLKRWHRSGVATTTSDGSYAVDQKVGHPGTFAFRTTVGGAPGAAGVVSSNEVKVVVSNAYVKQDKPVATIDALKNPVISGSVYPARSRVKVAIQVLRAGRGYQTTVGATTDAAGRYRAPVTYGNGLLATYSVRSAYAATNRPVWEVSSVHQVKRAKVLNAQVTKTTSAEVAKTYRRGCPVGPSKLRTITMNYFGFDRRMHRGVIIVSTQLTGKITRSFKKALDAGYPIAKMRNPNDYGGNDPRQMEANNTSGFNCRKVVGNPYAQSPHSYGIAIDVNTVQNPFRDRSGKWWPANGRRYIDRTPRQFGMLTRGSSLTKQLKREGYFWGGLWRPGRDYQHFEYNK